MQQSNLNQQPLRERVGLAIDAQNAADAVARIVEAERSGLRQVWMSQGGTAGADMLPLLAAAAGQTKNIRLGTSIVPIYPRHPLVTAQEVLAINDIAPNRFRLGLGPSHRSIIEKEYGLAMPSPMDYLHEYVDIVRGVLWNGTIDYRGTFFNVVAQSPRRAQIPILVSTLGPKAFRLAGEISDGAISWLCPVPYLLRQALPELRAGAESRQRLAPPVIAHVPVVMSADEEAVMVVARKRLAYYPRLPFYRHMFAESGFPVTADGAGLDELIRNLFVIGDEATVSKRLSELLASGLDELLLMQVPVADEKREREQLLQVIGTL